jgi:hypothetical protein
MSKVVKLLIFIQHDSNHIYPTGKFVILQIQICHSSNLG